MSTPSRDLPEFPQRLQQARRWRELSQEELGRRANLNGAAISHFETGARKPSFANLKRLADALSVTLDYLVGRTDEPYGVGENADKLFRDWHRMSADDQEFLRDMAATLVKRRESKGG